MKVEDHLPKNENVEYEKGMTFGERLSDTFADFAGQWIFLGGFNPPAFPLGIPELLYFSIQTLRSLSLYLA